jgi:hypothetical protein
LKPASPPILWRSPWRPDAILLGLALAAALLRAWQGLHAAWYWDEGYMGQIAMDLGHGHRPQAGALWEDGFFPLSASWLAPLSAAPFTRLPGLDPLAACRLWAALLGGLGAWLLGRVGSALAGPRLGLAAAAAYALSPVCIGLGALGIYHALGMALALAAVLLRLSAEASERRLHTALLLGGLAWASCYWLWWLPLGLGLSVLRLERRWAWVALAWGAAPLALVLSLQVGLGGEAAWRSAVGLFRVSGGRFDLHSLPPLLLGQPLAALGLLGLLQWPQAPFWLRVAVTLGLADLLRQRGDLDANAYVLSPLLPWLCLGLCALAWRGLRARWAGALLAVLALAWSLGYAQQRSFNALRLPAAEGRAIQAWLQEHSQPGDLILSLPPLDAGLRPRLRSTEPAQIMAAAGITVGHLRGDLPEGAWAARPHLEEVRYLVSTWIEHQALYSYHDQALPALRAEQEGWPLVWQGARTGIYANPRFGPRPDPRNRILFFRSLYLRAAEDAEALGLKALAAFARQRAADGLPDPPSP